MKLPNDEGGDLPISKVLEVLGQFGIESSKKADMIELRRGDRLYVIASLPICSHVQVQWLARKFDFDPVDFYARLGRCKAPN